MRSKDGSIRIVTSQPAENGEEPTQENIPARNLLLRPPHRKRSERGPASGSEGVCFCARRTGNGQSGGRRRGVRGSGLRVSRGRSTRASCIRWRIYRAKRSQGRFCQWN
jgi:hypothetical protein